MNSLQLIRRSLSSSAARNNAGYRLVNEYKPFDRTKHHGAMNLWKNLSLFVAFPAVIVMSVYVYMEEQKHDHHRPEFIPYEHLRIRTKKFPWGDGNHSLFHNPHANALPEGYEDE